MRIQNIRKSCNKVDLVTIYKLKEKGKLLNLQ